MRIFLAIAVAIVTMALGMGISYAIAATGVYGNSGPGLVLDILVSFIIGGSIGFLGGKIIAEIILSDL